MDLPGATVLLTGGSRGLGPVIARALVSRGARVALSARSADELEAVRGELEAAGGTVVAVPADVTVAADRERLVRAVEEALGPIDVLVNNAGMQLILGLADHAEDEIRLMFDLNLLSGLLLIHRVLPGMLERRRGHIVNMGSIAGKAIVPFEVVYAATKHAVLGFTLSLRAELEGTGVGVSVVSPGVVAETGMFVNQLAPVPPRGTSGTTPDRVAKAVVRAIEKDVPEISVMGMLGKVADIGLAISPRMLESFYLRNPAHALIRDTAAANGAARSGEDDG